MNQCLGRYDLVWFHSHADLCAEIALIVSWRNETVGQVASSCNSYIILKQLRVW